MQVDHKKNLYRFWISSYGWYTRAHIRDAVLNLHHQCLLAAFALPMYDLTAWSKMKNSSRFWRYVKVQALREGTSTNARLYSESCEKALLSLLACLSSKTVLTVKLFGDAFTVRTHIRTNRA